MGCETVRDLFSEFYDGVSEHAVDIRRHLDACAECRKEYDDFAALFAGFSELGEPDVPDGFHEALLSYVDGYAKSRRHFESKAWKSVRVGIGTVAAAAAAILLFVWQIGLPANGTQALPEMVELPMPAFAPFQTQVDDDDVAVGGFGAYRGEGYYYGDDWLVFRDAGDISDEEFYGDEYPIPQASFVLPTDDGNIRQEAEDSLGDDRLMGRGAEDSALGEDALADFFIVGEEDFDLDDDAQPSMGVGADDFSDFAARSRVAFDESFEPAAVVATETVIVRPHFLTGGVFLVVGFFLGILIMKYRRLKTG